MRKLLAALLVMAGFALAVPLIAQDDLSPTMTPEEQKDWLVHLLQDQLSGPGREIRLSNLDGALGELATSRLITIADDEGVWLRINNVTLNWDVAQIFLGRVFIRALTAQSIEFVRNPVASGDPSLPAPEAAPLSVPELPVAVTLDRITVPKVTFGESVFGLGSEISVNGRFVLEGGSLDADLDIDRLDGPGGSLDLAVDYQRPTNEVAIGVTLTEPPNGILANLLSIEGRPEIALSVNGAGPVADLTTTMTLDAGGTRALSGTATLRQQADGLAIGADLRGPIATLITEQYRPFFGAETALSANALVRTAGGVDISDIRLSGGQLALEGSATTTDDGFLRTLALTARIADPAGERVLLPIPGATTIQSADISIDYGGGADDAWAAAVAMTGFGNEALTADTLTLNASGVAANLDDPAARRVTFNGDGMLSGIFAPDKATQAALGESIGFGLAGLWQAGQPIQLAELRLAGQALEVVLGGTIQDLVFDGAVQIATSSIAPFSDLAGRELTGGLTLMADGTIEPLSGGFNLTLEGSGDNLTVDEPALDALLRGTVALSGRVARTTAGLEAENFRIANQQVQIAADGTYATGEAGFRFTADLADLALVSDQASGPLSIAGTAQGTGAIALDLTATVPSGRLAGRTLTEGRFGFTGTTAENMPLTGTLDGSAFLDGFRVDLAGDVAITATERRLSALRFEAGPTTLSGDLVQQASGLISGELQLRSTNITTAAALLLTEATGAVNANIVLAIDGTMQGAAVSASIAQFRAMDVAVGAADINMSIADLFGVPRIEGKVVGRSIAAGGVSIATLDASANRSGQTTAFDARAALDNGTNLAASGNLTPLDEGYRLALDTASLTQGQLTARLAQPAAIAISGETVTLDTVRLDVGGGRITATGSAGQALDIALTMDALPLSVANAVAPGLGLAGTLNGSARITGTALSPNASFNLAGSGINAAVIAEFGIAPLSFTANGSYAGNGIQLAAISAQGAGGLRFSGSGTVPVTGRGLDIRIEGSAPLTLANRFVADRGGALSGGVTFNLAVSGNTSAPRVSGTVSLADAGYIDPELNLRLIGISGSASLQGDRLVVNALSGNLATGGSVAVGGSIGLGPGIPADLTVRLNSARYADGELFVATVSGDLAVTGPIAASPTLSGRVLIEKADIAVPETFGGSAALIDVRHVDPPRPVAVTLQRATVDAGGAPIPQSRRSVLQLDVVVDAPNQVFIRGRGLDVEVGGSVRLTGPVDDIRPVGAFALNRGRLSILGQRLTFDQGEVTLVGDLDPYLNLIARVEGDGLTAFVTVSGRASEIDVAFTSQPALPQDEVLARILFKRSMGELSPLQIARLAAAAAELAGGGSGNSLVGSLRERAGLADLDIVTDEGGNVAVRAGRYIQDNIYLGVQAGADGDTRVSVDLDITDDVKARASTGINGESSVGVFYETDY